MTTAYDLDHLARVRAEYETTKADHALEDGCDDCTVGCHPDRIDGWTFVKGMFLCPPCGAEKKRYDTHVASRGGPRTVCINDHPLTATNTYYEPRQPHVPRCRQCRVERSRRGHIKRQAAKVAARGGA